MCNPTAQLCAPGRARSLLLAGAVGAGLLLGVSGAPAAPILFQGSAGSLAAEAGFEFDGTDLVVTLKNTSPHDVAIPSEILTGVFFDLASAEAITLAPVSAVLASGATVVFGGTDPGGVVGGEWAVCSDLSGAPGHRRYGISSSGLGLFGEGNRFPGSNLQGPNAPDGLQYGITSVGDDVNVGNAAVTGSNALIQSGVVFKQSGLPESFSPLAQIRNVWFQYGTSLSEGGFTPEPTSLALLMAQYYVLARAIGAICADVSSQRS